MAEENKKLTFGDFYKENLSSIPKEGKEEWEVVNEFYKEQLQNSDNEKNEYLAGWQRTKADLINYKKDEAKRLDEMMKYGNESLVKDLISVMDNFDLALRSLEKAGPVEKGIYLIRLQIEDILKRRGLEKITVKLGEEFDPAIMEAMTEMPSDHPSGTVAQEIEPGYRLHDKIVRAARVIISRGQGVSDK